MHHYHLELFLAERSTTSLRVDTANGWGTFLGCRGSCGFDPAGARGWPFGLRRLKRRTTVITCQLSDKLHMLLFFFDLERSSSVSKGIFCKLLVSHLRRVTRRRGKLLPLIITAWTINHISLSKKCSLGTSTFLRRLISFVQKELIGFKILISSTVSSLMNPWS